MSSGKIEKTTFIPIEDERSTEERIKERNRKYQMAYFKRLKEMFFDLISHVNNKKEYISRCNILIASLLNRDSKTLPDSYGGANEMPFNRAPLDSRIALAKEIGPHHKEVKNLSKKMEFFF